MTAGGGLDSRAQEQVRTERKIGSCCQRRPARRTRFKPEDWYWVGAHRQGGALTQGGRRGHAHLVVQGQSRFPRPEYCEGLAVPGRRSGDSRRPTRSPEVEAAPDAAQAQASEAIGLLPTSRGSWRRGCSPRSPGCSRQVANLLDVKIEESRTCLETST